MYDSVIYQTVSDLLINSALSNLIKPESVQITVDERPWPTIGDKFITIHPAQRYNQTADKLIITDRLSFGVTVGMRTRVVPTDRLAQKTLLNERVDLGVLIEGVIVLLSTTYSSNNNSIIEKLNTLLLTYPENIQQLLSKGKRSVGDGFRYLDADAQPVPRYPDFFGSKDKVDDIDRPSGHTLTARFLAPWMAFIQNC